MKSKIDIGDALRILWGSFEDALGKILIHMGMHWGRIGDALQLEILLGHIGMHWGRIYDAFGTHWDALGTYWGCIGTRWGHVGDA